MAASTPQVYFVLGTPGSGRRELVQDLVQNGLSPEETTLVLLAASESPSSHEEKIAALPGVALHRWEVGQNDFPSKLPARAANIFLLANTQGDLIDQLEALKPWLVEQGCELARILAVVDCTFASNHQETRPWFDALVHFSDVVVLTHREGVENKWLSQFLRSYEDECVPSLFLRHKKTGLPNPALLLEPQPRRLSQYFDTAEDFSELEIESDDDEEPLPGEDDGLPKQESYFTRLRSGKREKILPDIRAFFSKK